MQEDDRPLSEVPTESPADRLWALASGYQVTEAVYVVAVLGISDLLADGPRSVDELASASACHSPSLRRVLRALSTIGLYDERADGRFASTALGDGLRADASDSLAAWARNVGRANVRDAWSGLLDGVRTGEHPFRSVHGTGPWAYRRDHPDDAVAFDDTMTAMSAHEAPKVVAAYDFSAFGTVVDVGGGHGRLLAEVLANRPDAQGVLFDQPHVLAAAPGLLRAHGVADRVRLVGGDFFAGVPAGGDAYLLKSIVHDWDDEDAVAILTRCREAMPPDAKLLLVERLLGDRNHGRAAAFSDLNMMVMPGGRERSVQEYAALLAAAGLGLTRTLPVGETFALIESEPTSAR